ncbi:MAG: transcriptional regulator [candidate division WOR-3 bacterium]
MKFKELDPIIHEKTRLSILIYLLQNKEVDFSTLKKITDTTEGNLSSHLRVLEDNKLIEVKKTFVGRRPKTFYKLSDSGKNKLLDYLDKLKKILKEIK